jgi:hypothetical protein
LIVPVEGIQSIQNIEQRSDVGRVTLVNDVEVERPEGRSMDLGRCAANYDESHPGAVQLGEERGGISFLRVTHAETYEGRGGSCSPLVAARAVSVRATSE